MKKAKISIQKIDVEKGNDGRYVTGPAYFIRTATDTPDWKNDHYVSPLNYVAVEKGKQYDVFYPGIYTGTLKVYFVKTRDGLGSQTNNITDIVGAGVFIDPNEEVRVSASSNFMIFGHYNKDTRTKITEWGRDGEPANVQLTEYNPDTSIRGPLYMCEFGTVEPDFLWDHWHKAL